MDRALVERLKLEMEREASRVGPPEGFPAMPRVPTGRYTDPAVFELERERLWPRTWLLAAHRDELPHPGSYRLWSKSGPPIVIVRGRDDEIRAFYNACQHRGAPLVRDEAGSVRRFVCRYHAWTYELDGQLVGVPDEQDFPSLDRQCLGLRSVRCETWGGWIFVNQDPQAPPLRESLGPIPDQMEQYGPDSLRFIGRHGIELPCNWKTAVDAFVEVYHLKSIHPTTVSQLLDHRRTSIALFEGGHSRMVSAKRPESLIDGFVGEGVEEISGVSELPRVANLSFHVFPNLVTPTDLAGFPFLQFWPIDRRRTELEVSWYVADWGEGEMPAFWKSFVGVFDLVLAEDTENLESIQDSMESPGFQGIPLSYQERRIYHYQEALDRMIGPERLPESLRLEPLMDAWLERAGVATGGGA